MGGGKCYCRLRISLSKEETIYSNNTRSMFLFLHSMDSSGKDVCRMIIIIIKFQLLFRGGLNNHITGTCHSLVVHFELQIRFMYGSIPSAVHGCNGAAEGRNIKHVVYKITIVDHMGRSEDDTQWFSHCLHKHTGTQIDTDFPPKKSLIPMNFRRTGQNVCEHFPDYN